MLPIKLAAVTTALFGASLAAQAGPGQFNAFIADQYLTGSGATGLGGITQPAPLWMPSATNMGLVQIQTTKGLPNLTAGQWAMALTTYSLNAYYGGTGTAQGVILGTYDRTGSSPVFTPTTLANKMNGPSGNNFGLMLEPRDGLYAAVDWSSGPVISWRSSVAQPFPTPIPLTPASGTPTLTTYVDPAPAYVNGNLVLFYMDGVQILHRPITPTFSGGTLTSATIGNVTTVVVPGGALIAHSPTPVIDKQGNTHALWCSIRNASDSDMYFAPTLDPTDTAIMVYDNAAWLNNGAVMGGTFLFCNSGQYSNVHRGEVAWLMGSNTPLGGTATMTVGAHNESGIVPVVVTQIALSLGVSPPFALPGFYGQFALGSTIRVFANATSIDKDELGHWSAPVPNDPNLKGIRVYIQGLSVSSPGTPTFTNTSVLTFH